MQGARQRIFLVYRPGEPPEMSEVGDDGSVPFPDKRRPTAIVPEIPVYPVMTKAIPLTGTGGHSIVLRFEKNDIGRADFSGDAVGDSGWGADDAAAGPGVDAEVSAGEVRRALRRLAMMTTMCAMMGHAQVQMTPVLLAVQDAPVPFMGSDGRMHLVYELWMTNFSSADVRVGEG